MSKTTYEKFNSAFSLVAAYAILHNGAHKANITFKFPAKGEGKLHAFVHWIGSPMQTGFAGGYGYDKRKAALNHVFNMPDIQGNDEELIIYKAFKDALADDSGKSWEDCLRGAGFTVITVIGG